MCRCIQHASVGFHFTPTSRVYVSVCTAEKTVVSAVQVFCLVPCGQRKMENGKYGCLAREAGNAFKEKVSSLDGLGRKEASRSSTEIIAHFLIVNTVSRNLICCDAASFSFAIGAVAGVFHVGREQDAGMLGCWELHCWTQRSRNRFSSLFLFGNRTRMADWDETGGEESSVCDDETGCTL
jgi:hypothetical protein